MKHLKGLKQHLQLYFGFIFFCGVNITLAQQPTHVPREDLHVHLSGNLSIEQAVHLSTEKDVQFGIVEHPGLCDYCPLRNDSLLESYITNLQSFPVYIGLQPVVPGWRELFSANILSQLDYIIMDALEIPGEDDSVLRIWIEDTRVPDPAAFMEMYVKYNVRILTTQNIDVLANATYLPKCLQNKYDVLWTAARMQQLVDAAVENGVAFEINSYYKVPKPAFIRLAKDAGVRFSFGTNSRDDFAGTLDYALEMVNECGLESDDIFVPTRKTTSEGNAEK